MACVVCVAFQHGIQGLRQGQKWVRGCLALTKEGCVRVPVYSLAGAGLPPPRGPRRSRTPSGRGLRQPAIAGAKVEVSGIANPRKRVSAPGTVLSHTCGDWTCYHSVRACRSANSTHGVIPARHQAAPSKGTTK